jgi:hypothetical protein
LGTDSDQEVQRSLSGKIIQTKAPKDENFKDLMSQRMSTSTCPTEHDKAREAEPLQKYMDFLPKMDKSHNLVDPKTAADDQGRVISSLFQAIDAKTQSLIEIPMTSDTYSQNELKSAQASIALAGLKKHFCGREHSSIKRQVQVIHAFIKKYSQSRDLMLFKREFLAELAIFKNLWRFFSKPMDKMETERDFCKMLLKEVAKSGDMEFVRQLQRELDLKDASPSVEGLLTKLEENQRLLESLEAESPAKSRAGGCQELKTNPMKREPSNPLPILRFSNNPNAHRVGWNMIFYSVQKKRRDSRKKRKSAENDFMVRKSRPSVEASIIKMSKSKKKTTVVALCVLLLDGKAL